jgi:hypothetical protein
MVLFLFCSTIYKISGRKRSEIPIGNYDIRLQHHISLPGFWIYCHYSGIDRFGNRDMGIIQKEIRGEIMKISEKGIRVLFLLFTVGGFFLLFSAVIALCYLVYGDVNSAISSMSIGVFVIILMLILSGVWLFFMDGEE